MTTKAALTNDQVVHLPIEALQPSPTNPRRTFDAAPLAELAESLKSGVQVPLIVRTVPAFKSGGVSVPEHYEVVAGGRRLRAGRIAELKTLPCIVRELTDAQVLETQILENLHRQDVHPVEEAEGYRVLMTGQGGAKLTPEDIAKRVGKSTAHVARRLRLLDLQLQAKELFHQGHLTAIHAELLARLEPADQLRALDFLFEVNRKFDKRPIEAVIAERIRRVAPVEAGPRVFTADEVSAMINEWDDAELDDAEGTAPLNPDAYFVDPGKYPEFTSALQEEYGEDNDHFRSEHFKGERVVEATEAQLKAWISSHVLLQLGKVPWGLDDATLVPEAGACTTCPKRSGANVALFGDLTAAEDICLDTVCYAAKQTATLQREKDAFKVGGGDGPVKYLKLSAKSSNAKLTELAVDNNEVITRKSLKLGQWLPSEPCACGGTAEGLIMDGPDKGTKLYACADQGCKVHKHTVSQSYSSYGETPEQKAKAEAERKKQAEFVEAERPLRAKVFRAVWSKVPPGMKFIRAFLTANVPHHHAAEIASSLGIEFKPGRYDWESQDNARKAIGKEIGRVPESQLEGWAWLFRNVDLLSISGSGHRNPGKDREALWEEARARGLDPDALAGTKAPRKAAKAVAPAKTAASAKKAAKRPAAVAKKAAAKRK